MEKTPSSPKPPSENGGEASAQSATKRSINNAGVQFPVEKIKKKLKKGQYSEKVGSESAVYMAAVLEYLTGSEKNAHCTQKNSLYLF